MSPCAKLLDVSTDCVLMQFAAMAMEEEQQLAHFATSEQDNHENYARYANFVSSTCDKRMHMLEELKKLSSQWLDI